MRWFCVAPDLPAKASLRVRAAPHSEADVCGRFSKGKAVAALSNIFKIADESGASECQRWLHVTFPEETSGDWIEGFVMTELANGMTLLVPWEDAGFYSCCNVTNDRAVVYEGPEPTAQALGLISEGEGTRFPYGVREVDGHRLRIFHDVHERVWVDAADVEFVCERLEHGKCTAAHSFFTLNEELPPEAQIAVREFPSREAETRALLSRGQVIEADMRCGSWLKIAGSPESWIMWRTDTWQLLTELPFHSSGSCALEENDVDMDGGGEMQDEDMGTGKTEVGVSNPAECDDEETQDMEVDDGDSTTVDETAAAPNSSTSSDHGYATPPIVTSLCDGLALHDISNHEDDTATGGVVAERQDTSLETHPSSEGSHFDDRPLNVKHSAQASESVNGWDETQEVADNETTTGFSTENTSSSSWEDRPIGKSSAGYDWESEFPPTSETTAAKAFDSDSQEPSQPAIEPVHTTSAKVDANEMTNTQVAAMNEEMAPAEEVAELAGDVHSWEDRPITASRAAYDWESEYPPPVEAVVSNTSNPASKESSRQFVEDEETISAEVQVEELNEFSPSTADAVAVGSAEATHSSWEDRPISNNRGVYDWESEYPLPDANVVNDAPHSLPQDSRQQQVSETGDATSADVDAEMEATEEVVEPARTANSWDDRPISKSRGVYDWESEYPLPVEPNAVEESEVSKEIQDGQTISSAGPSDGATVPKEEPNPISRPQEEAKGKNWDDAPIKSRFARKAAGGFKSVHSRRDEDQDKTVDDAKPWRVIRKQRGVKRSPVSTQVDGEQDPASAAVSSETLPVPALEIGFVSVEENSNMRGEDLADTPSESVNHSQTGTQHTPPPAVGVVSSDISSVAWHSSDSAEDPGVFDNGDDEGVRAPNTESSGKSTDLTHAEKVAMDLSNVPAATQNHEVYFSNAIEDAAGDDQITGTEPHKSSLSPVESMGGSFQNHCQQQTLPDDMEVEDDGTTLEESQPVVDGDCLSTHPSHLGDVGGEAEHFDTDHNLFSTAGELNVVACIDPHDYSARLIEILQSQSGLNRILKAIALNEGSDAILEALATTGEFDEELLKYEFVPPSARNRAVAPSPSTSESALLDVLYSRDQDDALAPKKRRPPPVSSTSAATPYASESKEDLLARILRRTPQKSTAVHSLIVNNANPDDILEAQNGSLSDELDLFENYRYPAVSQSRFSSGLMMTTPTRTAFGSLPSPSFASSSFSSPPPKENPLKRSAAAIAKTPPVVYPKSTAMPQPLMPPPAPMPTVRVPGPDAVSVQAPAKPTPVLTKPPTSSRLTPGVRTPTALPRPSLVAPSRLRAPSTNATLTNPAPAVNRARSFTASNDVRPSNTPLAASSTAAPASGVARTQSMLPRKSALQAPSPIKFGITRTNNLGTATAPQTTTADSGVDPRRLSFGFARPSSISKKP